MPPASTTRVAATPAVLPPPRPAPGVPSGSPALASGRDRRPAHRLQTTIIKTPCDLASDPGTAEPQRAPAGQDWQDVALPLRLLLGRGPWLAIATVVGARGAVVRRPGTVLAVTEAGQIIGFNPAGPLDRAIPDLAAHHRAEQAPPPADRKERRRLHRPVRPDQPGRFTQPIVHPGLVMTSRRRARNAKVPGRFPARGLPVPASVPWSWQATGYTVRPQARRLPTAGRAVRQPAGRSPAAVTRTDPP